MSTRKSARLTAKVASTPTIPSMPQQRPRKRQKTPNDSVEIVKKDDRDAVEKMKQSRVKGKRGHLLFVTEMPLDILLEVFSNLEPIDLLHLSRASQSLRKILTSTNTAYIWKLTYENIPSSSRPPKCPGGISLIHYTNYLYGRHCHFCASIRGRLLHDSALVRFCHKCIDSKTHALCIWSMDQKGAAPLCSSWGFFQVRGEFILRVEYDRRQRELVEAKKNDNLTEYQKIRKDKVQARTSHAHALDHWRLRLRKEQAQIIQDVRKQREEQIYNRLLAEGYGIKCQRLGMWRVPYVCKAKELTDLEWQHIRADVIDFVQDDYEENKAETMKRILSNNVRALGQFTRGPLNNPNPLIVPAEYYIASYDPILSFLQSNASRIVLQEEFKKFRPQLLKIVDTWRKEVDEYLVDLVLHSSSKKRKGRSNKGKAIAVANPLELAATLFKCHWCTEPITYPRILAHRCLLRSAKDDDMQENKAKNGQEDEAWAIDDEDTEDIVKPDAPREPRAPKEITVNAAWTSLLEKESTGMKAGNTYVTFDEEAQGVARNIIQICGEDPGIVTQAKMNEKNAWLECLRCSRAPQGKTRSRLVMNWTTAILHDLEAHYGEDPLTEPGWRLVDSQDDISKIQDVKSKMLKKWKTPSYYCKHCGCIWQVGQSHLKHSHRMNVDESHVHEHFYMDFDAPMKRAPLPVKI